MRNTVLILFIFSFPLLQSQEDSSKVFVNSFSFDPYTRIKKPLPIDTTLEKSQLYNPIYDYGSSFSHLGFVGAPSLNNHFYFQTIQKDYFFDQYYSHLFKNADKGTYYNTNAAYTLFNFSFVPSEAETDEQIVELIHTQNINPKFNAGFDINFVGNPGQYQNQTSRVGHYQVFSSYEQQRFKNYINLTFNKASSKKSGGIYDSISDLINDTRSVPVRLLNAYEEMNNIEVLLTQQFDFKFRIDSLSNDSVKIYDNKKPYIGFFHTIEYSRYKRFFEDKGINDQIGIENINAYERESAIYPDTLINENFIFDSTYFRSFNYFIGTVISRGAGEKFSFNANASLFGEFQRYYSSTDTSGSEARHFLVFNDVNRNSYGYVYNVFGRFKKFNLNFYGKQYIFGYKAGNADYLIHFNQTISKRGEDIFTLNAKLNLGESHPSYFMNNFGSNSIRYNNKFDNIQFIKLRGEISFPKFNTTLGATNSSINNYIYFADSAYPKQFNNTINVTSFFINNILRIWKFSVDNRFFYQIPNYENVVPVPNLNLLSTLIFSHDFYFKLTDGGFKFQFGADLFWTSKYNSLKYMPVNGQFYVENSPDLGNYFYIDPFINVKVSRLRAFIIYQNLLSAFQENIEYYTVYHYPHNKAYLKFGVYWSFYN